MTFRKSVKNERSGKEYLFGGKELQDDDLGGVSLGWVDFGWREYDPQLGRWHCIDKLAENYMDKSPYVYCANNPINYVDIDGRYFDEKNEKKAQKIEKKLDKQIAKLEKQVAKLEKKGKDIGDRKERLGELGKSKTDISGMRTNEKTEFRYASANDKSNPAGQGNPTIDGIGSNTVTMYVEGNIGSQLHESRHGGDVSRGTLTNDSYGVQDEVSAYRAQYSFDGNLSYLPADFLDKNPSFRPAFESLGSGMIPPNTVNNIGSINANLVGNIGSVVSVTVKNQTLSGLFPLYPPAGISSNQWKNN